MWIIHCLLALCWRDVPPPAYCPPPPCIEIRRQIIEGEQHVFYANSACLVGAQYFAGPTWLHFPDKSKVGFQVHGAMIDFEDED